MAKKKAEAAKPKAAPKPEPEGRKPMIVQIRGSRAFKEWAEGYARANGDTLAKLFDRAVRKLAKDEGHPAPPNR